jgi:predicted ATPase
MKEKYLKSIELLKERVPSYDQFPFCLPIIKNMKKVSLSCDVHRW